MLKEMPGRPVSREQEELDDLSDDLETAIGGVLLAAGQSRRMGRTNKMLVEVDGAPMVIHAARALLESGASPIVVVLGHQPEQVEKTLAGLDEALIHKITHENAMKIYGFDPFATRERERCTAGALRAESPDVDVVTRVGRLSSDRDLEAWRELTSGRGR